MTGFWASIRREPRPVDPPPPGRGDRVLVAAYAAAALYEGLARPDLSWRPLVIVLALTVAPALLWRRQHPLWACLVGFGAAGLLSLLHLATGGPDAGLSSMTAIEILLYALVRWGSGREILFGSPFVVAVVALGMAVADATRAELIGGILFVLLFAALGAVVRSRADLWDRERREIRNEERLALARELHDTVAHHVSAIAVQAQAGGVVAGSQPARAAEILAAIEAEASRTLTEMRGMVRVLRDDMPDAAAPHPGIADLPALARTGTTPVVQVAVTGALTGLTASVDAAVYRIAREALTNARRHARGATKVDIEVSRVGDVVRLRVADDGRMPAGHPAAPGFGLTGMAERAELLGGSLGAGPAAEGGWLVEAALPAGGRR